MGSLDRTLQGVHACTKYLRGHSESAILLHSLGRDTLKKFQTLPETGTTYKQAKDKLPDYFHPKINTEYEKAVFHRQSQSKCKMIYTYVTRLRSYHYRLRKKGLMGMLTLDEMISEGRNNELCRAQTRDMERELHVSAMSELATCVHPVESESGPVVQAATTAASSGVMAVVVGITKVAVRSVQHGGKHVGDAVYWIISQNIVTASRSRIDENIPMVKITLAAAVRTRSRTIIIMMVLVILKIKLEPKQFKMKMTDTNSKVNFVYYLSHNFSPWYKWIVYANHGRTGIHVSTEPYIWYQTPLQFHIFKQYNDQAPLSCYDLELKEEAISRAKKLEHYKKSQNNMPSLIPCLISVNNIIPMTLWLLCLVKQKSSWASTTFRRVMATFSLQLCCALRGLAHSNLCPFCNSKHTAAQCYCPAYAAWNCQPISSSKQATDMYRGQGPNNQGPTSWHWRHKPLDVAGPKVLIVPTITYFSSERAPLEISSSIVNGLMFVGRDLNVHKFIFCIYETWSYPKIIKEISSSRIASPVPKPTSNTKRINTIGSVQKKPEWISHHHKFIATPWYILQ